MLSSYNDDISSNSSFKMADYKVINLTVKIGSLLLFNLFNRFCLLMAFCCPIIITLLFVPIWLSSLEVYLKKEKQGRNLIFSFQIYICMVYQSIYILHWFQQRSYLLFDCSFALLFHFVHFLLNQSISVVCKYT